MAKPLFHQSQKKRSNEKILPIGRIFLVGQKHLMNGVAEADPMRLGEVITQNQEDDDQATDRQQIRG